MNGKNFVGKIPKWNEILGNLKNSGILSLIVIGIAVMLSGSVNAANCGNNISCTCGDTVTSDYVMTNDLNCSGNALNIGASSITIDCNGHRITGYNTGYGIGTPDRYKDNFIIKNCNILNFSDGIYVDGMCGGYGSDNNVIMNNTLTNNNYGIRYYTCQVQPTNKHDNNQIIDNTIKNNNYGIYFFHTGGFNLTNNVVCKNNNYDISLDYTNTNTYGFGNICNNTNNWNDNNKTGCTYTCDTCTCDSCESCTQELNNSECSVVILTTNILNHSGTCIDNPANFNNKIFDCTGHVIDGDGIGMSYYNPAEGIYLNGKEKDVIKNCVITNFLTGVYLNSTLDISLTNNTVNLNRIGIHVSFSSNITLINNTANLNTGFYNIVTCGIDLYYSSNTTMINNTANLNRWDGICLSSSSNTTMINNTANLNEWGISLNWNSSNNLLINNTAKENKYGIYIMDNSNFNKILNNKILNNNEIGITVSNCNAGEYYCGVGNSNNSIEGNEILNNKIGIFSKNSNSTINYNYVCGNTQSDFNSTNWIPSSGDNNYCDKANGWNDTNTIGCRNTCKAKDLFDLVEMFEYLSGQKNLSYPQYCDLDNDKDINLPDVFVLIDNIVTGQ